MHALCKVGSMPVITWVVPLDYKHSLYYGKYRKQFAFITARAV